MRKKVIIISAIAAAVFALTGLLLNAVVMSYPREMLEYKSSEKWGAEAHSHIAAYMTGDKGFNAYLLLKTKSDLESAYTIDSIETANALYSASYETRLGLTSADGSRSASCAATVYSGDYFKFREFPLTEGAYPTDSYAVSDTVLIDELAAWQLFGTKSGVVGMEVYIGESAYTVSGITEVSDGIYTEVYGDYPRIYIRSDSAALRQRSDNFTVFEAMLPDPITNYAVNAMTTAMQSFDPVIRNIDERFEGKSLTDMRNSKNKLITDSSDTDYPFTEKAMLLLTLDAADVYSVKVVMYYIALAFVVILFFAIYSPIVKFIEKQLKRLRF